MSVQPTDTGPGQVTLESPAAAAGADRVGFAFALVTSLFFLWGLSYGLLDTLNKHFQETLDVSRAQSALLQMAYFGAYFVLALPAAAVVNRWGYKFGILMGLSLFAVGALLFVPATAAANFHAFLFAVFVLASGLGCLETAANPYVTSLGARQGGERRLNLSQSFNGLGQFLGPLIGGTLFFQRDSHALVQSTYVGIAALALILVVLVSRTRMPDVRERERLAGPGHPVSLPRTRHFVFAVVAQFCYVAAQVGVGTFFINYATEHGAIGSQRAAYLLSVGLFCFLVGRFVGTALMGRVPPARLLGLYAIASILLTVVVVAAFPGVSVFALVALFFFMSIMFPTIFALGIRNLGDRTRRGGSILIMSIVGGALAPYVMGRIADSSSTALAFLVPAVCFAVVAWYGFRGHTVVEP
jgi:FHS family L-fucose permease-like MFS transporter